MINRFNKLINNKYSRFFKFIFFLRYLFTIFIISISIFLIIPSFFNYEEKAEVIKAHVKKDYNIIIKKYEKIEFKAFPLPRLEIRNVVINFDTLSADSNTKKLKIYPKLLNIYAYENFQSNKIVLKNSNITLDASDLIFFVNQLLNKKKKFLLKNFNLRVSNKNKSIVRVEKVNFSNYGYNKNLINGKIFNKRFKINLSDDLNNASFNLIGTGISADFKFDKKIKKDFLSGFVKSKIFNTNLKFNFIFYKNKLDIKNLYFRSKDISFNSNNSIFFDPFTEIETKFVIKEFNSNILKKINLRNILEAKKIIKKINSKNEFYFKSKKFSNNFIDELILQTNMNYGRINYLKKITISKNNLKCKGDINLTEEYPLLFFDCSINANNKKKFLEIFSIKSKSKNKNLIISFSGNISVLNKKINFKNISLNENYEATKEDLKFFKETFESVLFDKTFFEIFNEKKIKKFILEIT